MAGKPQCVWYVIVRLLFLPPPEPELCESLLVMVHYRQIMTAPFCVDFRFQLLNQNVCVLARNAPFGHR